MALCVLEICRARQVTIERKQGLLGNLVVIPPGEAAKPESPNPAGARDLGHKPMPAGSQAVFVAADGLLSRATYDGGTQ